MTQDGAAPLRRTAAPTRRGCVYADGWDVLSISPACVLRSNACKVMRRRSERPASQRAIPEVVLPVLVCACLCVWAKKKYCKAFFSLSSNGDVCVLSSPALHLPYKRRLRPENIKFLPRNSRLRCLNTSPRLPPTSPAYPPRSLTKA